MLYFYPKDFTMGCTTETRAFGENYESILEMGAEVIGVSSDTTKSHEGFARECGAKFPLLSDRDGKVRDAYGAKSSFGMIPGRVTYVIDREGIVRHAFSSQMRPKQHVSEAVETLRMLT